MTDDRASRAAQLHRASVIWDAHTCLPLCADQDMSALERHRRAGASFVSVNVGMDFNPLSQVIHIIAGFRAWIAAHADRYVLAGSVADIALAKRTGKLAVGFDLEGSAMLEDDLALLALFSDLGVRQIHLAYNRNNSIAGGCHDRDVPLSALGRLAVREINAAGLIMDCSHSSFRTSMEVMEISERPVVFSHSNVRALNEHPRNVTDDQIEACARTDGVIGLSGIGIFLGRNDIRTETLLRHIDHVAERVGARHVGLGLDYVFEPEHEDLPAGLDRELWWPSAHGYDPRTMAIIPPERLPEITEALLRHGFADEDVAGIMGENFRRVAAATWPNKAGRADS